jgi:hypothetical protein
VIVLAASRRCSSVRAGPACQEAQADAALGGLFVQASVLTGLTRESTVVREEVFGPALAALTFTEEDEAVKLADDTPYGLAGAAWTKDVHRAHRVGRSGRDRVSRGQGGVGGAERGHSRPVHAGLRTIGGRARPGVASPIVSDDIIELIFTDHETFRRGFAELDELSARNDPDELARAWEPLAALLDVHAVAEEEIFYPQLLRKGEDDPTEETLDAIGDHNDIRDGIREARRHPVGSEEWWAGVHATRLANDEHLAEEEREGLADFRRTADAALRESLGRRFAEFKAGHPGREHVDTRDKDPRRYVETVERELGLNRNRPADGSLGIGGLR